MEFLRKIFNANSLSYESLDEDLKRDINGLYKKYVCRYEHLKKDVRNNENPEHLQLIQKLKSINALKIYKDKALVDFIPVNIRVKLLNDCSPAEQNTTIDFNQMDSDFTATAQKIHDFEFAKSSIRAGFHEMKYHPHSDGGSKKKSKRSKKSNKSKKSKKSKKSRGQY